MSGWGKVCIKSGQTFGKFKHVRKINHGKTTKSKDISVGEKYLQLILQIKS